MFTIIITTCLFTLLNRNAAIGQEIPEDVELVSNADGGTGGSLPVSFNTPYYQQAYPVGLFPQQQLVRPNRLMTFLRQVRRQMHTKLLQTHFDIVQQRPTYRASATLISDNADSGPMGKIIFTQHPLGEPLMVTINATGLPAGKHALHIHAFGDLREGCKSTGPHVRNILIGNVEVKEDGKLEINFHSPYLSLFGPNKGVVGRSIVIHEKPIEYNRFPDIRGFPIVPTLNDQNMPAEEMAVGAPIACGIITFTDM